MKPPGEVLSQAIFYGKVAMLSLQTDKLYQNCSKGKAVIALVSQIDADSESFKHATKEVTSDLLDIISSAHNKLPGPAANSHVLKNFQAYRTSAKADGIFSKLVGNGQEQTRRFLQQYMLRVMLEKIMKDCVKDEFTESGSQEDPDISVHDEQVLRYLAGYIPFALHRRYSKLRSNPAKRLAAFLDEWKKDDDAGTEADTFLQYTSVWLTYQNRGGLFVVSDKVYTFFRSMEFVSRKVFGGSCLQHEGETLKDKMGKYLCGSSRVQRGWNSLACELEKDLAEDLFETVIQYWIKIRISAYVRSYVSVAKNRKRNAKKGKKSLRKGLKNKNDAGHST